MKTYNIKGQDFEFDETKTYYNFFIDKGVGSLVAMPWDKFLTMLQAGTSEPNSFQEAMILLDRWRYDAPRKRFYRGLVKSGMHVLSGEQWFQDEPDDRAEEIFTGLENSGKLANKFLETFMPEVAAKCADSESHPATKHYIDP